MCFFYENALTIAACGWVCRENPTSATLHAVREEKEPLGSQKKYHELSRCHVQEYDILQVMAQSWLQHESLVTTGARCITRNTKC